MATSLTQTTLSAACSLTANSISVTSATGFTVGDLVYCSDYGTAAFEAMGQIQAISGTTITVNRGGSGSYKTAHVVGALVITGPGVAFQNVDPSGPVAASSQIYTPYINVQNGNQWLVGKSGVWVPGFNNSSRDRGFTADVASAAGLLTPSGPLFAVTGTAAITGITRPVGFVGGSFTIIPKGVFTWTAANNIPVAGTAVVNRALTFTADPDPAVNKYYPSYV